MGKNGVQTCKIQKPGTEEGACPGSVFGFKIREDISPNGRLGKWYRGGWWKVGEHVRKGTDLAGHLEQGRTPDQVSAVFRV